MSDEKVLSSEELIALNKDIETAKHSLSSKETEEAIVKAREQGRLEAEKELKTNQAIQEEKARVVELEKKLKDKELEASTALSALQKRVDEMASSKGVISNPQNLINMGGHPVDKMTDAQVDRVEEEAARAFFGSALDRYGTE
jgi:hypothetical protein